MFSRREYRCPRRVALRGVKRVDERVAALRQAPAKSQQTALTWRAEMPKICRARLAIPANSFVGSCAYNQSSVRPRQSSLSIAALIPGPSRCSTGLLAKNCGTKYNCRLLNPNPLRIIATVAVPTLTCWRLPGFCPSSQSARPISRHTPATMPK